MPDPNDIWTEKRRQNLKGAAFALVVLVAAVAAGVVVVYFGPA